MASARIRVSEGRLGVHSRLWVASHTGRHAARNPAVIGREAGVGDINRDSGHAAGEMSPAA